ncbi:MAG: ABC transporter permease [Defluviitaleaceae bacterium]|nr:ABC transporter permease [Defluviitaleaceae bacterium]
MGAALWKKTAKRILLSVFAAVCLASALCCVFRLEAYKNIITLTFEGPVDEPALDNLAGYDAAARAFSRRNPGMRASNGSWSSDSVSLYECGNSFLSVHPLDILHGSFDFGGDGTHPGAVIDSELAWRLFSGADCVGRTLELSGKTYIVNGVCKRPALAALTTRERYAVYAAADEGFLRSAGQTELTIITKDGLAPLLLSKLSGLGAAKRVDIDAISRMGIFWTEFLFCALLFAVAFACAKIIYRSFSSQMRNSEFGAARPLIRGRRDVRTRLPFIIAGCAALALFIIVFISLEFAPDRRMIPGSLIDAALITERMYGWFNGVNSGEFTGGPFYAEVRLYSRLALASSAAAAISAGTLFFGWLKTAIDNREN